MTMRSLPFLLIAGFVLVMVGEADAIEPEWNYIAGDLVYSVDISADGDYVAAGSWDGHAYLFGKENSTPLWSTGSWDIDMETDLSDADASFWGENADDRSGSYVSGVGDVNGDGYDDFIIGAPKGDRGGSNAGQTYLILGDDAGWIMDTNLSNVDASFIGEDADDWSGYAVSGAGDVNGDGYDDFIIGAYANDDGGNNAGQTYLILGKASDWAMDTNLSDADASFIGEDDYDYSGYAVSGAGDVNDDGYDDFIIGAHGASQTYLIMGKASGWAMGTNLSNVDASFMGESGRAVSGAGDVNADGYDDFLIGARMNDDGGNNAGQTYLILGKASGWAMDTNLSDADASFIGEDDYDESGHAVSGAGDVNGDGYDDFIIGGWDSGEMSDASQTYLILGKASGWAMGTNLSNVDASFIGESGGDVSGYSVSGVGDFNGDGYDDFIIGAPNGDRGDSNAGQTYLILGKASGWAMDVMLYSADGFFCGENADDISGSYVSGVGDVNGDGYDDFIIGAPANDDGGDDAGQTYLILGRFAIRDSVRSVAISADGEYIAVGSYDDHVYLFGKDNSTPLWSYNTRSSWQSSTVYSVAISADGEYIAAGTDNNTIYLFNKDSSTPLWTYTAGNTLLSVSISADGEYITAGSVDKKIYLFNKGSSTPLWSYTTGANVYSVDISADGKYITAGSGDSKVYLFDRDSSTPLWTYDTGTTVLSVSISADGEYIAAGSINKNKTYLFDKDSSTPLWIYTAGPYAYVVSVAISADGEYIAAGTQDNKIYLFGKDSSTPLWSYTATHLVDSVAISADGEYIAASSRDGYVYLFLNNLPPTANIDSIEPSPAKKEMAVFFNGTGSDSDGTITAYEWTSNIDGFLSDEEDFSISVLSIGYHNITFRVQDDDGNWSEWDTAVLEIYPNAPPVGTIDSINPSPARFDNMEVTFNGTGTDSDGVIVAYEWTSDIDGFLSDEEDFSITGFSIGIHTISFRVQDNNGNWSEWNTAVLEIYPNAPPVGTIDSINPSPARFDNMEVTFNGAGSDSDGTIAAYEWTSDIDGFLSDEEDFSITGFSIGYHNITFRVQDNDGDWSNWSTAELEIYPNAPPVGTIDSIDSSPAEIGTTVFFNGTGSDSDGTVVSYLWESSIDGDLSTEANFSSNSLSLGHHTITFRVQDNDGDWSNPDSELLWIYAIPRAIAGDDSMVKTGDTVQFSGEGTDEDGNIAKYEWDFDGNGIYEWSSEENGRTTNIYNNKGTFIAVLRVTDNDGFTATDSRMIIVSEKDEDELWIPSVSLFSSIIAIGIIALRRRY